MSFYCPVYRFDIKTGKAIPIEEKWENRAELLAFLCFVNDSWEKHGVLFFPKETKSAQQNS